VANEAAACWWDGGPDCDPVKTAMRTPPTLMESHGRGARALGLHQPRQPP
jgi:hypothetical protein